MISTVTMAGLRAISQSIAEECDQQSADFGTEVGPAVDEVAITRAKCLAIIVLLDASAERFKAIGLMISSTIATPDAPGHMPERTKRALDDYATAGLRTGDCLYSVLSNDLRGAFARADPEVAAAMPAIITYVCSCLPSRCWGSPAAVEAWLRKAWA